MIASLAAWLVTMRVPARLARPLVWLALALIAAGALWGAKALYDRAVIERHDATVEARAQKDGRRADAGAAEQRGADQARIEQEADELERIAQHDVDAKAAASIDDARRDFYRCVRVQQAARRNGERPPACR